MVQQKPLSYGKKVEFSNARGPAAGVAVRTSLGAPVPVRTAQEPVVQKHEEPPVELGAASNPQTEVAFIVNVKAKAPDGRQFVATFEAVFPVGSTLIGVSADEAV